MKIRQCDFCNKTIEGKFIKCCESSLENHQQKLVHVGDVCLDCWKSGFRGKESEE